MADCGLRSGTEDGGLMGVGGGFMWKEGNHRLQVKGGVVKGKVNYLIINLLNNPLCGFLGSAKIYLTRSSRPRTRWRRSSGSQEASIQ